MHVDLNLRLDRNEEFEAFFDEFLLPDRCRDIELPSSFFEVESDGRESYLTQCKEVTSGFRILIWILPIGDTNDTDLNILIHEVLDGGECRLHSRIIGIKGKIDAFRKSFQSTNMILRKGGSTDPDDILDTSLMERNGIHLSFDDEDFARFCDLLLREVHRIEDRTLIEDIRCGRVEVFREGRIEDTSSKCDDMPHTVRYREGDTTEEFIPSFRDKNP